MLRDQCISHCWWHVDAWLKVSTLLAQFVVSPFVPILLTKEPKLSCLLSCLSKRAVEHTVEMQVSRKLMKLRSCYCYVICHLVIDDIIVPVCGETLVTSGFLLQGITGVELWWSSVRRFHRRWIPLTKARLDVIFYVCLNKLFNKQYSCQWVEIPRRVCDVIVMYQLSIRHSAWLNIRIITLPLYWKSNRTYQIQRAPIRHAR